MNDDRSWFWNEGYCDGFEGLRWICPDETRHSWQRSDYAAGYESGSEDRAARADEEPSR
jgi:hypothetical protein